MIYECRMAIDRVLQRKRIEDASLVLVGTIHQKGEEEGNNTNKKKQSVTTQSFDQLIDSQNAFKALSF